MSTEQTQTDGHGIDGEAEEGSPGTHPVTRRHFLAGSAAVTAATALAVTTGGGDTTPMVAAAVAQNAITATQSMTDFLPRTSIAKISALKVGQPVNAMYPDPQSPVVILKTGRKMADGVGPDGDIVAYSAICTHKGCQVVYRADNGILICPCHFSAFDPNKGGMQIIGQATTNLPQVVLEVNGDDLFATDIQGLIYGRESNVL